MARLANDGAGYRIHITAGQAKPPPPFREVECPPYPLIRVALDGGAGSFMQNLMSQHYAIVYGDVREPLLELCRMLRIRPVIVEPST